MKILFVVPRIPFPIDTGAKIRTYNIIRHLSDHHEVSVLGFADKRDVAIAFQENVKGVRVIGVKKCDNIFDLFGCFVMSFFRRVPYLILKYECLKMAEVMQKTVEKNEFDIIHFDHIHMAQYALERDRSKNFLDQHNVEHQIAERYADSLSFWPKQVYVRRQAKRMKQYERRMIEKFQSVFAVSELDQEAFQRLNKKAKIGIAPNGVNCQEFSCKGPDSISGSCFFIGSMDWWPNIDGVRWFVDQIWPELLVRIPSAHFNIIGRNLSGVLGENQISERIQLHENVADVRPHFYQNDILIVPLRMGGGTRIKILEAMAAGRPVVSTSLGAEGIKAKDREHIMIADSPENFIRRIQELIEDPDCYRLMAAKARCLVEKHYDWKKTAESIAAEYQRSKTIM